MQERYRKNIKLRAQQLVEFALVAPIIIMVIFYIIEIGYAINIRSQLADAIRLSVAQASISYNQSFATTADKREAFRQKVEEELKSYVLNHGLPFDETVEVNLADVPGKNKTAVILSYKYSPFFSLPYDIALRDYQFYTTQIVNNTLLEVNNHNSSLSINDLGAFWKTTTDLDGRKGIVKDDPNIETSASSSEMKRDIAFLVAFALPYTAEASISSHPFARLFNWWGQDLLPPNLYLDIETGNLAVYSPYYATEVFDTGIPFVWVMSSLGFTHGVYTKNKIVPIATKSKLDIDNLTIKTSYLWCDPLVDCDSDMSEDEVVNQLKVGFGINYSSFTKADGSYDSVSVSSSSVFNTITSYQYSFLDNTGNDYLIKLFVPNSSFPDMNNNLFSYEFSLDPNGKYVAGTGADLVDCYMDNDADGIPNAWDMHPDYIDMDANGTVDGQESVMIDDPSIVKPALDLPERTQLMPSISYNDFGTCEVEYNSEVFVDDSYAILPKENNSIGLLNSTPYKTILPNTASIGQTVIVTFDVMSAGCGGLSPGDTIDAVYIKYDTDKYVRRFNTWDVASELAEKSNFINGSISGSTIDLNRSRELDMLESDTFTALNKVTH